MTIIQIYSLLRDNRNTGKQILPLPSQPHSGNTHVIASERRLPNNFGQLPFATAIKMLAKKLFQFLLSQKKGRSLSRYGRREQKNLNTKTEQEKIVYF